MNELIPDKQTYQTNKRRMAWSALGMMIISTIAVLIDPARMAEADAVLMICMDHYRHWLVLTLAFLAGLQKNEANEEDYGNKFTGLT